MGSLRFTRRETLEVCHDVLQDPTFFRFLSRIDLSLPPRPEPDAVPAARGLCTWRTTPVNPVVAAAVREEYSRRPSFTCGRCDARSTSPSVRFADRRVYLAVVLMLRSSAGSASGQELCHQFSSASRRARSSVGARGGGRISLRQPFWQSMRERFIPPLAIERLPQSLVERFDGDWMTD
jgi:hypothetical protein